MNKLKEDFIRDMTLIKPRPKSEVRRRLNEIIKEREEEIVKIIERMEKERLGFIKNESVVQSLNRRDILRHNRTLYEVLKAIRSNYY